MESRNFFTSLRLPVLLLATLLASLMASCASQPVTSRPQPPAEESLSQPAGEGLLPQQAAAREFTERGRRHLERSRPDEAIRDLERALSLDAANGQTYYYLAEAWLMKIDAQRAGEFNRMAENHFQDDPQWLERIARQADRIAELEK